MVAQFITISGETIALCLAAPDLTIKPEVSCSLPVDIAWHPIAKSESRRNFAGSNRYSSKYRARFSNAADATEFRMWLNRLHDETVALPSWVDRCVLTNDIAGPAGATVLQLSDHPARYGAEWIIFDGASFEVVVQFQLTADNQLSVLSIANSWPAGTPIYPLLFGRLEQRPELTAITPEKAVCDLSFKENSPFARRLDPYDIESEPDGRIATVGPGVPNLTNLPLWDIEPNHVRLMDKTEIDTVYTLLGFGRMESKKSYPNQSVRRGLEFQFYARNRDDIAKIENFFFDRRGTTRSFMIPTFRGDTRLTSDLPFPSDATIIPIEDSAFIDVSRPSHPGDLYVALVDSTGGLTVVEPHKLTSYNSVNLSVQLAVSQSHAMRSTRLSHLMLVRFADAQLTWQYLSDNKASCTIKFIEQPNDYADGGNLLKEPVYLYRFTHDLPVPQISRFTSYENEFITNTSEIFEPGDFTHGDAEIGLDLQDSVEVESQQFDGNPLNDFFPFVIERRLLLDILEADAANPAAAPVMRFSGEVWTFDPKAFKATIRPFGRFVEGKFPAFLLQTLDNDLGPVWANPAAWLIAGVFSAGLGSQTISVQSSAAAAKPAGYFAQGWLETGAGANFESRPILHSTPIAGGVRLTIDRPLLKAGGGQAINLYPGYDGTIDQREAPFNDRINFAGHPYAPDTPPSIKVLKTKNVPGGKKG